MTTPRKSPQRGPGRPRLPASERRVSCSWYLSPKTRETLRKRARAQNVSMAKFLTQLIEA